MGPAHQHCHIHPSRLTGRNRIFLRQEKKLLHEYSHNLNLSKSQKGEIQLFLPYKKKKSLQGQTTSLSGLLPSHHAFLVQAWFLCTYERQYKRTHMRGGGISPAGLMSQQPASSYALRLRLCLTLPFTRATISWNWHFVNIITVSTLNVHHISSCLFKIHRLQFCAIIVSVTIQICRTAADTRDTVPGRESLVRFRCWAIQQEPLTHSLPHLPPQLFMWMSMSKAEGTCEASRCADTVRLTVTCFASRQFSSCPLD